MNTPLKKDSRSLLVLMAVFIIVGAGIIAAGYFYYLDYRNRCQTEVERQLTAVSELKADGLVQWRKERLGDAAGFYGNEEELYAPLKKQLWLMIAFVSVLLFGVGAGLSLVKRIVEIYKGAIWLESEGTGRGTCFRFTLPEAIKN